MRKGMVCKNCEYFKSFGDEMNPRIDGICLKMRLTNIGFVQIHTKETYFCSLFKKPERREEKNG